MRRCIRRVSIRATRYSYARTLIKTVISFIALVGETTVIPVQGGDSEAIVQLGRLGDIIKMHLSELLLHAGVFLAIKVR